MNNEYAIEVLEEQIKERKKYIDNWETKDTKLIRANISLLQSAIKQLSSANNHTDKNTEAYCETLQRENQFLRDKLSSTDKVIAGGKLGYIYGGDFCLIENEGKQLIYTPMNKKRFSEYNGKKIILREVDDD